jgi:hypothetical protein
MGSSYITHLLIYLFLVKISGTSNLTQKPITHLLKVKRSCIGENGNSGFTVSIMNKQMNE